MKHNHLLLFLISSFLSTSLLAQQWEQIIPAQSNPLFESPYFWSKMAVIDADTVWFADDLGRVTLTKDGGKTWDTNPIQGWDALFFDYYLGSFFAADSRRAFAVAFSYFGESFTLSTKDGGKTWDEAFKNGEYSLPGSFLNGIHFFNRRNGLAWGDPVRDTFEFYRTTDAGDSWQKIATPAPRPNESSYFEAFAVFGDTIWIGTSAGRTLKSANQGQTWTVDVLPTPAYIGTIALTNGHEGAVSLNGGRIYYTANNGKTWTSSPGRSPNSFNPNTIYGVPGQTGIFVSSNQFDGWADISFDSCKTWPISILQPGIPKINTLQFLNAKQAWATLGDSAILKWKNPAVLFDLVEPDYTEIKAKHATGTQISGARVALWSGIPGAYRLQHTLLKDAVEVSTSNSTLMLAPRKVGVGFSNARLSGKGNYFYRTTLLQGDTIFQQQEAQLVAGDSVFSKDNAFSNLSFGSNRGHFFDLGVADQLTSIATDVNVFAPTAIQFWVFGYDSVKKNYSKRLHLSSPIPLEPKDTLIVFGKDTFLVSLPLGEVNYQLPKSLALNKGRYAIGIQFLDRNAAIYMSTHKVSSHAILKFDQTAADSLPGYAFGPILRARFNTKEVSVSTQEPDLTTGIRIFPNPASDWFSIDLSPDLLKKMASSNTLQFRLFNINGQEVQTQWLAAGINTINVAQLPTGTYVWQIVGNNRRRVVGQVVLK
ncbi:MAG: T9SS type A sorting domain-containing protein [Haliscomenobacter sp.]|uniref:T9SS type A sorting domain-containing protein n=1 Tax=Haliscomenobacter sp. TaxID=2717303 RepID=UPI0029AE0BE6|nr:T9SS type A sorting domain-containing protein [Haliscomenobacter sp.]MDX2070117.1 T9SS type A sorting domain-containing protein [Haliscomenobacter sp.]